VVVAVKSQESQASRYGQLFDNTKLLLNPFPNWECYHVPHEINFAAHGLAKEACKHVIERSWIREVLGFISDIVLRE
jgi:hypothetical protein